MKRLYRVVFNVNLPAKDMWLTAEEVVRYVSMGWRVTTL